MILSGINDVTIDELGAVLSRTGETLVLVLENPAEDDDELDDEIPGELVVVDLTGQVPVARPLLVSAAVEQIESRSVSLTSDALFLSTRHDDGKWYVERVLLDTVSAPEATAIAGPYEEVGRSMAVSKSAVAFLAGKDEDELDVFVATSTGNVVNVTQSPGPVVETDWDDLRLAVSDDGCSVAYNVDIDGEPELFLGAVCEGAGAEPWHVTNDSRFNPYIDQEVWVLFTVSGDLVFTAGHSESASDVFRVGPGSAGATPGELLNLTQSGSPLEPPFLTTGELTVDSLVDVDEGVILVSANGQDLVGVE